MEPSDLRADIPALETVNYMNTGAAGPSPRRVVDAIEETIEHHEYVAPTAEGMYDAADDVYDATREAVADHLGADHEEIALTTSTADGVSRVAAGMDWSSDDVVVRTDIEHPAGILPWQRLRDKYGVEVRVVNTRRNYVDRRAYEAAVEDATLVAFSSLCWTTGARLDVEDLVDIAHDAGARVLIDAVQSVGQHPVDVKEWGADAVAAAGHKWLLGPWGAGLLYVDREFAEELHPAQVGYKGVEDSHADPYELKAGAQRFEIGTLSPAPYAGLQEGIATIEDVGFDVITSHVATLTDRLKAGLDDDRLVSPPAYESGLVSWRDDDPEGTVERLQAEGIRIRSLPDGETVRASLHVFNTEEDVDELLEAL
jgi:selenocysteine lyase/cysteine desulfurase